jgi:hypothetical protein
VSMSMWVCSWVASAARNRSHSATCSGDGAPRSVQTGSDRVSVTVMLASLIGPGIGSR